MAVAFAQTPQTSHFGTVSSWSLAYASNVTSGNVLIVTTACTIGSQTVNVPTDTFSTTYTQKGSDVTQGGVLLRTYQGVVGSSGANTVSQQTAVGTVQFISMSIMEVSGSTGAIDQYGPQANASASGTLSSASVTPGANNSLIIGVGIDCTANTVNDFAAGSGFTMQSSYGGTADWPQYVESQTQSVAASIAATFTATNAAASDIAIITLKPSGVAAANGNFLAFM